MKAAVLPAAPISRPAPVTLGEAFWVWAKIALLSFGGPAGQIAVMHRVLVEEKRWIGEHRFLHALNYCMLLPGPEAQQLATYIGWLLHKRRGGVMAGVRHPLHGRGGAGNRVVVRTRVRAQCLSRPGEQEEHRGHQGHEAMRGGALHESVRCGLHHGGEDRPKAGGREIVHTPDPLSGIALRSST